MTARQRMDTHEPGQRRLVSFLGLGPGREEPWYQPVQYLHPDTEETSQQTPLLPAALHRWFSTGGRTLLLGTEQVEERWLDPSVDAPPLERYLAAGAYRFWRVLSGESEDELRDVFDCVRRALAPEPLAELGEEREPDEIIVDVTHGFRIQPMIGLAAVAYQLGAWKREGRPSPPRLRVLYGAYEAGYTLRDATPSDDARRIRDGKVRDHSGRAPVWDLTTFVEVAQWNEAISALLRFGRADDLAFLTQRLERAHREAPPTKLDGRHPDPAWLERQRGVKWVTLVGGQALKTANAIATLRTEKLITQESVELYRLLEESGPRDTWLRTQPLLEEPFKELREWAQEMQAPKLLSREGMGAVATIISTLVQHERHSQALVLLNEALAVVWRLLERPNEEAPATLEQDWLRSVREDLNAACSRHRGSKRGSDTTHAPTLRERVLRLALDTQGIRNDTGHAGFRQPGSVTGSDTIVKRSRDAASEFADIVMSLPHEGGTPSAKVAASLANLSGHAVDSWPGPLRDAVERIVNLPPMDMAGLVEPPPSASISQVITAAETLAVKVVEAGASAALLSFDRPQWATALTACLQRRAVTCWALAASGQEIEALPDLERLMEDA